jgi:hypothetical protein
MEAMMSDQSQRKHGGGRSPNPQQGQIPTTPQAVIAKDPRVELRVPPGRPEKLNSKPLDLSPAEVGTF